MACSRVTFTLHFAGQGIYFDCEQHWQCVTALWARRSGVRCRLQQETSLFSKAPQFGSWGPPTFVCTGSRGPCPRQQGGECVNLTTSPAQHACMVFTGTVLPLSHLWVCVVGLRSGRFTPRQRRPPPSNPPAPWAP